MIIKEQIENTVKEILQAYPKLKEIIDNDFPWKIMKTDSAIMIEGTDKYLPGWNCFITSVNETLNFKRGHIAFSFDEAGEPKKISVYDMGRPNIGYITKNENGNYKISEK
ncbi:hypothetical protein CHRY9390_00909 [Chryseobacterium aquaeductus]|uniref:Uncharacterized protein n=1 Tax=Chryseobacterium aquaeductus TaxID=2675056 RepID=A0A9N8MM71_9FLAO|nr:hypothetical protein [Chryseobacterium aquaeductus]CAA7330248.1 hypothetical protein CHRY9390_00909 [Chryseobacterium potabilaquae]CAD7802307.1 hypothetical protein CHRY9390_00909 [Chryseobacterium aquaeductus]